jgi:RNA polymerase sigma factor (sigma-70 family)
VGLALAEYEQTLQRLESSKVPSAKANDPNEEPYDNINQIPSQDRSPFESCSMEEDLALLRSCIDRLNPRWRRVLELYYFGGVGLKQIGAELGVGEARVSQIHKRAIEELRRIASSHRKGNRKVIVLVQSARAA